MLDNPIVFTIFLIFTGAAILATIVLYTRQSILVAYILLGCAFGPWGLKLVPNINVAHQIGEVGIIFLLFLLGLDLNPRGLMHMLRKVTWVALLSSIIFAEIGYVVCRLFDFSNLESLLVGAAMMFSSTIIGLKLLPTTILHHQRIGEIMTSILLMQDLFAILILILLSNPDKGVVLDVGDILLTLGLFPLLILIAFVAQKFILTKLLTRFERIHEYIFLLSIGWCLGIAELARFMGLSEDIGAFIAGISIATGPIALYIANNLKPLRDFFLVMFFFSVGASFNLQYINQVIIPATILAGLVILIKPLIFKLLLKLSGETKEASTEVGVRLAQGSEFSLLIANVALLSALTSNKTAYLIQAVTILTFIASSYIVVLKYATPIAFSDKMRRD